MKPYKKIYLNHFDLIPEEVIYCEYSFIVLGQLIRSVDLHHIEFGRNKHDHINNLMAVSREVHNMAHNEQLKRDYLKEIHLEFMNNNPY